MDGWTETKLLVVALVGDAQELPLYQTFLARFL
jgi:hypothetical protein